MTDEVKLHGVKVGKIALERGKRPGEITVQFRPNWPGLWHAAAKGMDRGK